MKAILTHSLILVMLSGCSQGNERFAGKWTGNYGGMRQTFTITPLQANTYHISVPGPFGLSKEYDATYNGKKSLTTQAGATFDLVEDNMLMVCDPGGCNRLYREGDSQ